MGFRGTAVVLGIALVIAADAALARARHVTFRTDDGVTVAGMWYEPSLRPGPAVILVHMLHRTRRDFEPLAHRLASEGIGALAIDLRGHGESSGSAVPDGGAEGGRYSAMVAEVRAARRFLASRADVYPSRIGIAGASIGANLAALAAASDPAFAAIALLSPSLDYRGLRIETPMRKLARPALLVASDDDPYAARSARELQRAGGGARELIVVHQAGHGTAMLSRDADLVRTLVDWFRRTL
jgi:dienelactone hydrolase